MPKPKGLKYTKYKAWHRIRSGQASPEEIRTYAEADWSQVDVGTGGSGKFKDISPLLLMAKASQMHRHPFMSILINQARFIESELRAWILSYSDREAYKGQGFVEFCADWRSIRVWIPLQMRLCAEQIFWELSWKDARYKKLITGFAPMSASL